MKKKLLVILITIVIGIITASFYFFNKQTCHDCHLIVFDADIFRADGLNCEETPEITPNLCEIKDEFIRFNNHHSPTDLTKPGMASFLTSSYPATHGVWNEFFFLDKKQPNIVNVLKENKYHTIIHNFESSQVISNDYDQKIKDFNYYKAKEEGVESDYNPLDFIKNSPTFLFIYNGKLHYPYLSRNRDAIVDHPNKPEGFPNNEIDFEADAEKILIQKYPEILQVPSIKEHIEKQNGLTKGIFGKFLKSCASPDAEARVKNVKTCWKIMIDTFESYIDKDNPKYIEFIKYLYQERIRDLDKEIGKTIDDLKSRNLWNKTVFAVRSDHGEEFMEHNNLNHSNNLYQELVRVPFWVHIPNKKGVNINNLTQTIDEAPTLLNALGIKPHPIMQGRNLLNEKSYKGKTDLSLHQKWFNNIFSIREGNYK